MRAKPLDGSVFDVIQRADDFDLAALDPLPHLRARAQQVVNRLPDIRLNRLRYEVFAFQIGVRLLRPRNRWSDRRHEPRNAARDFRAGRNRGHRAALRMTEYHQQRRFEVTHAVLDGAGLVRAAHVSGHADDEDAADPLVEQPLDGAARVGAGQHRRERMLPPGSGLGATLSAEARVRALTAHKSDVAVREERQRSRGCDAWASFAREERGRRRQRQRRPCQDEAAPQGRPANTIHA